MDIAESILDSNVERAGKEERSALEVLDHLIKEEVRHRRSSPIETWTNLANFPARSALEISIWCSILALIELYDDMRSLRP